MTSKDNKSINLPYKEGQKLEQVIAEYILEPKTLGAFALDANTASVIEQVEFEYAREVIGNHIKEIKRGDLSKLEEMLYSQAIALNMMFTSLSRRASNQSNIDIRVAITNLSLKSQNQSRSAIQTLLNLKQPNQTAFIKQQTNVANGHQQINNGVAQSSPEKFTNGTNELLEEKHGKWLVRGTQAKAEEINSKLEALAKVHRGKNSTRKSKV